MTEGRNNSAARKDADTSIAHTETANAADVARFERTDAVSAELVHSGERYTATGRITSKRASKKAPSQSAPKKAAKPSGGGSGEDAKATAEGERSTDQGRFSMRAIIADAAVSELDESDEFEGAEDVRRTEKGAAKVARQIRAAHEGGPQTQAARSVAQGDPPHGKKRRIGKRDDAAKRLQSRRTWLKARAVQEKAGTAATNGAAAKAKGTAAKALATAAASAAGPIGGVLAGALCFVLAVLAVSQIASVLFGFWSNEASKASLEGLPPYITVEMVEAALECQEEYGHPAGCTLAQIICESGQGDRLSALAERDKNLFGIKWASSFLGCPEVAGKSSWATSEEYGGETVGVMADFTVFKGHRECVVFRSRVLLANPCYAENTLIREAVETCDSDKMAEGLKDAGYATSSAYVSSLKSAMDAYGLRRFDGMSLDDFRTGAVNGDVIVAAAMSQLGVPYVWGGTMPGAGLDCSGLTQYCYAQAGISIPRYSEDQASAGRRVPLSEAEPGDILWRPGHVAIYLGGDEYIHEPQTGDVCRKASGIAYFTCAIRYR